MNNPLDADQLAVRDLARQADHNVAREVNLRQILAMRFNPATSTPDEIERLGAIQASPDPIAAMDAWTEERRIADNIEIYGRAEGPTAEQVRRTDERVAEILGRKNTRTKLP